ncbi:MAG: plasmid pRiA4b ORF-3 family protein [Solirubrobacteraceae bacterium]
MVLTIRHHTPQGIGAIHIGWLGGRAADDDLSGLSSTVFADQWNTWPEACEMSASARRPAMQVKLSLRGVSEPPVWRRLLLPANMRLDRFHDVIQTALGWTDTHLHVFSTDGGEYGVPDPELGYRDERRARLEQVLREPGDRIRYTYDFGGDWEHDIEFEKHVNVDPDAQLPACVGGKGGCPPEDCGGVWGYADLKASLASPDHEEHGGMLEWLGLDSASDFDPAACDPAETNDVLNMVIAARR